MKNLIFILALCFGFASCQKEVVEPTHQIFTPVFDGTIEPAGPQLTVAFDLNESVFENSVDSLIYIFEIDSIHGISPNTTEGVLVAIPSNGCGHGFTATPNQEYVFRIKIDAVQYKNLSDGYYTFVTNSSATPFKPIKDRWHYTGRKIKVFDIDSTCTNFNSDKDFYIKSILPPN